MNLAVRTPMSDPQELDRIVDRACARIAPTWPLDRFIAVNPLWGFVDEPLPRVSARIASLAGSRFVMPRSGYREQWEAGHFGPAHLREAIAQTGARCSEEDLVALLVSPDVASPRRALVTDVLDARRDTVHGMAWCDFVAHSLSQFCAAHFDEGQSKLGPDRTGGLYSSWRRTAERDWSPVLLMGFQGYRAAVRRLPSNAKTLIRFALEDLEIPEAEYESYLTSLLLRLNGWASWCAYRRWQARLAGGSDDQIIDLLALRLAWEWLLLVGIPDPETAPRWRAAISAWPALDRSAEASLKLDWVLQRALEIAYQDELCRGLAQGMRAGTPGATGSAARQPSAQAPSVQAAFCIDVRSEVFRRALEGTSPNVQTLGFAGFFGLPIEYQPLGSPEARPQLPGLLAPGLRATDCGADAALAGRRSARIDFARGWKQLRSTAISGFSVVEALGLLFAGDLVGNSLGWTRPAPHPERTGLGRAEEAQRRPRLSHTTSGAEIDAEARADLAAGILRAMSLTQGHARIVALFGHGSDTVNNPHAAGLDCGACCGQTGEVNARVLAALLNDADLRSRLAARGIEIPETTHFVAGLHHTTDDEISLYDLDEAPASHRGDIEALRETLREAGRRARAERAAALGLAALPPSERERSIRARTTSWSETRPEWGLAGNAAFIVAPRERSRHLELGGRSFLHEYRWEQDAGFGVLELIMTAPMIVTHWINFQYYASTVDNERWGSGNKVLHNVVGGHLGIFEGNGGDLRIGLPLQSLHDGSRWVHTPLRISVFIDAPRAAIDAIVEKHEIVRNLVENEWIFLFQIDAENGEVRARRRGGWAVA